MSAGVPRPDPSFLERSASRLVRFGLPGALLAALLLKLASFGPSFVLPFKSAQVAPIVLLCCTEISLVFGGTIGLLVVIQWLAHEWAHAAAARRHGHSAGWRLFVPLVGVYLGTTPRSWPSREAEAEVAVAGIAFSLSLAFALVLFGGLTEAPALVIAGRIGFALVLVQMLPFRPLDGGHLFPGMLWRLQVRDATAAMPAEARLFALCALLARPLPPAFRAQAKTPAALLGEAITGLILGWSVLLLAVFVALPPVVFVLGLLLAIATTAALIAAVLALDPRRVKAGDSRRLLPRDGDALPPSQVVDLPWRERTTARAALVIHIAATAAALAGVLAG